MSLTKLPPELVSMICEEVEDEDIPSLRLTCKFLHDVATPYLLGTAIVYFKQDSFERLIEISKHPVIGRYVYELIYQPNVLHKQSKDSWERSLPALDYDLDNLPTPPDPYTGTEREWRTYRRTIMRSIRPPHNPYTKQKKDGAWEVYQRFLAEQDELRTSGYGFQELQEAIAGLPKLQKVYMNHGWSLWPGGGGRNDGKKNPFRDALALSGGDHDHEDPSGVPQMRALMMAVHNAGLKLHTLHIGDVSWKFLQQDEDTIEKMKTVLKSVHSLALHLSAGYADDDIGDEIPECREFLANNKLHHFLRAAPDVSVLEVRLSWNHPHAPTEFKHIFGDFTYSRLRHLQLEAIDTTAKDWLIFFEKHASTLKTVEFNSIRLLNGKWAEVLEGMQKCLKLKSARVGTELIGRHPLQNWQLEPSGYESRSDERVQENRTRKAIEHFLVHGGACPLRDSTNHPQQWFRLFQ